LLSGNFKHHIYDLFINASAVSFNMREHGTVTFDSWISWGTVINALRSMHETRAAA